MSKSVFGDSSVTKFDATLPASPLMPDMCDASVAGLLTSAGGTNGRDLRAGRANFFDLECDARAIYQKGLTVAPKEFDVAKTSDAERKEKRVPIADDGGKDRNIDAAVRKEAIDNIGRWAKEGYVFPEKGEQIDRMLHERMSRGEYDKIESAKVFANKLTDDIQGLTGDKHFEVNYYEGRPIDESLGEKPSPKQEEQWRKDAEKDHFGVKPAQFLDKDRKIGYLRIDGFANPNDAAKYINEEMKKLSGAEALIIDLRYNRGGDPHTVNLVANTLLPAGTHINDIYWRKGDRTEQFWTQEPPAGTRIGAGKPVYVLTSHDTFSGGEELANDLKSQGRAVIVGQRTGGGANPGHFHRVQDHFAVFVPDGRSINPIDHGNWESVGVVPDQFVTPSVDSKAVALKMAKMRLGLQ